MAIGISTPTVKWNGRTLAVVPNSVEFNIGGGEKTVRAMSAGGGSVQMVHTRNAETFKGMLKFGLPNTAETIGILSEMQEAIEGNSFEVVDGEAQVSFPNMSLIVDPAFPLSQDGQIDLEFEGAPATVGGNL